MPAPQPPPPAPGAPARTDSLTSDLPRLWPSRRAPGAATRGLDFARATSPPPPARRGPATPPAAAGALAPARGAAPAARRARPAGQARVRGPARRPRRRGRPRGRRPPWRAASPAGRAAAGDKPALSLVPPPGAQRRACGPPELPRSLSRRSVFSLKPCGDTFRRLNNHGGVEGGVRGGVGRTRTEREHRLAPISASLGLVLLAPNPTPPGPPSTTLCSLEKRRVVGALLILQDRTLGLEGL